ncbi:MAG: hypothetical protein P8X57_03080 [Cyclobacteriaceae bacterium]
MLQQIDIPMTIIPYKTETLVSTLPPNEVLLRLHLATMPAEKREKGSDMVFQGIIADDHFRISQNLRHPNNFVPMIEGTLDETSHGSIIFIKYKLFFSSVMFLVFWTFVTIGVGAFLIFTNNSFWYAGLAFFLGALNYLIVILNFNKQVGISHNLLLERLNISN